jgi:hypothetical protein
MYSLQRHIFQDLFGWDYSECKSLPNGGILGKLDAHYRVTELTERGGLHGHFLLWLKDGLNPSQIHSRMKLDPKFKQDFFNFFDDTIQYHLPDVDVNEDELKGPDCEPRVEHPVAPPPVDFDITQRFDINTWTYQHMADLKRCGEKFQRHGCRKVCFKYGSLDCRFMFPHDVVEAAFFDEETDSIYLTCRDPTMNYHNKWMVVYCRHNHDIKCILSGSAARSAMYLVLPGSVWGFFWSEGCYKCYRIATTMKIGGTLRTGLIYDIITGFCSNIYIASGILPQPVGSGMV